MSVFDLFRGFFGRSRGLYRGDDRREAFLDGLTPENEDDEAEDMFDDVFRFGFSFGPNGMRIQEPLMFSQILQEMEEMYCGLGHFSRDLPKFEAPGKNGGGGSGSGSGNSLRDEMLKTPNDPYNKPPPLTPRGLDPSLPREPSMPSSSFFHLMPFSKFQDIWSVGPGPRTEEKKEDGDLDSQVSSSGLDQIFAPAPTQPKTRSFFQSITVTKVVKPDGTIEEKRTVRDDQGNEETRVTHSGGHSSQEDPHDLPAPPVPGGSQPFADIHDEFSLFSKFFGTFRS